MSGIAYELFESAPDEKVHTCCIKALHEFPEAHRKEFLQAYCISCGASFIPDGAKPGWIKIKNSDPARSHKATRWFTSDEFEARLDDGIDYWMQDGKTKYQDWVLQQDLTTETNSIFNEMGDFSDVQS